jgi:hypothetical protein
MNIKALNKLLTDAELIQLDDFLSSIDDPSAMNMEMLDGYFVALICGPEIIMPSEYLANIWGEEFTFHDDGQAEEILNLVLRHWNTVTHGLLASLGTEKESAPFQGLAANANLRSVATHQEPTPEHGADLANPYVEPVNLGYRLGCHCGLRLAKNQIVAQFYSSPRNGALSLIGPLGALCHESAC